MKLMGYKMGRENGMRPSYVPIRMELWKIHFKIFLWRKASLSAHPEAILK